ncbi:roadblock/LC7 domain-containing protein [Streptomyces marianii]|uniref:Roadblock/LC7 domain-containing protein n=1 Tax=Streptomyces marianii TaxID=1817406 RepID=A0A5R9DS68_9ACTN|nr:roadblock/LC7 domain-containing protein [Streptomyces marianii]TLQ39349.1 roadblock/LC7 domain-containing protein [Streptomyces marianii]
MSSSTLGAQIADPSWVLDPITTISGVHIALIISSDGIVVGVSEGTTKGTADRASRDTVDRVSAAISSLHGASRAAAVEALGAHEKTPISTITVQLDVDPTSQDGVSAGTLMVMPVGGGTNAYLAAAFGPATPMGIIAQTMAKQAKNLGEQLMAVSSRNDGPAS